MNRLLLTVVLIFLLSLTACESASPVPAEILVEIEDTPMVIPSPTAGPGESATVTIPINSAQSGGRMEIPTGWYGIPVAQPDLDGEVFVRQDPDLLATFNDPDWAAPFDFAAGALLFTPLPPTADPDALQEGMKVSLPGLTDEDFEAMLAGADKAGLINLSAVSESRLETARVDSIGGRTAILLEGTVHFDAEQPPILQGRIWLAWTDEAFVVYYELAAETIWSLVRDEMELTRRSIQLP